MDFEAQFDEAERLEREGDQQGALELWRQLANSTPCVATRCALAKAAHGLGHCDEARQALNSAVAINPRNHLVWIRYGELALEDLEFESAVGYFRKSLECRPSDLGYFFLGYALRRLDDDAGAELAYREAIRLRPDYDEAYYNLGVLLRDTRPGEAEQCFRKTLEIDPDDHAAHRELGWVLAHPRNKDLAEGEYHIRRALELRPRDPWAHVYLGNLLWRTIGVDEAIEEFKAAIDCAPKCSFPLSSLAEAYEGKKEWELARIFYEKALDVEPDDEVANMSFGRMFKKMGNIPMAKEYLERALFLDPDYEQARKLLDQIKTS